MQLSKKVRLQLFIQKIIFFVLILALSGMLAWLTSKHATQFDWTRHSRNSLSQNSLDILKTLDKMVTVNVYIQDDPTLHQAVEEILKRYQRHKEDFSINIINPDLDILRAQADEVTQYGQIAIHYNNKKEFIASLSEQTLTSALLRLSKDSSKQIVFLTGHGERDIKSSDNKGYSTFASELSKKGSSVDSLNLLEKLIPDNTHILVIAGLTNKLLPGELKHILEYVDKGGNVFWMADPGKLPGLRALSDTLEITFLDGTIVDNNIDLRKTLRIDHPAVIPVLEYYPHAITENIQYNTLFPLSRGVQANENTKWKSDKIINSLARTWSESSDLTKSITYNSSDDIAGPITIGLALERILSGKENSPNKASQRIVVMGDSDFLSNSYVGAGANLSLGLNIINWLAGDDDLISIEPKNAPDIQLVLSDTATVVIGLGFFLIIPITLTSLGLIIWYRRKKQ